MGDIYTTSTSSMQPATSTADMLVVVEDPIVVVDAGLMKNNHNLTRISEGNLSESRDEQQQDLGKDSLKKEQRAELVRSTSQLARSGSRPTEFRSSLND